MDEKEKTFKYLVEMFYIASNTSSPLCVCATEGKAQEWIINEMEGYRYDGTGYHRIRKVEYIY